MQRRWILANEADSVAIALVALDIGEQVAGTVVGEPIPAGHRVAIHAIAKGAPIIKLGHRIGNASAEIPPGAHVHGHNLAFAGQSERSSIGTDIHPPLPREAVVMGYVRANGRVGTRNYVGVLTSVNCSATVVKRIDPLLESVGLQPGPRLHMLGI